MQILLSCLKSTGRLRPSLLPAILADFLAYCPLKELVQYLDRDGLEDLPEITQLNLVAEPTDCHYQHDSRDS